MNKNIKPALAERIRENANRILDWNRHQLEKAPPPFYCSVDLRDSGYKIVPVDCNIYPAGFNNICPEDLLTASPVFRAHVEAFFASRNRPSPARILVLPESHTLNRYYIENLHYLLHIITEAGFEARLGWFGRIPEGQPPGAVHLVSQTGKEMDAWPVEIHDGLLSAGGFIPDLVVLNNDFAGGYPASLDNLRQPVVPSHVLGWHTRKKGDHFRFYNELAGEFADLLGLDRWLLQIATEQVEPVNFATDDGLEQVIRTAGEMLDKTRQAFAKHEIDRKPFAFIKDSSGTYGMGIMVIHSVDELRSMNRRARNKMSMGKDKHQIRSVVVQEGIPTATLVNRLPAEPVIYLFGDELIGGFLRTHQERGTEENLNSPGMVFQKLCMSDLRQPESVSGDGTEPILEQVYGTIARLSAFAAGRELARLRELRQRPATAAQGLE